MIHNRIKHAARIARSIARRFGIGVATSALGLCALVASANAEQGYNRANNFIADQVTVSDIISLTPSGDHDAAPISGASNLTRTQNGVGFDYNTADLEPNAPYTMWWVAFNRPKNCLSPCECGLVDLADPAVKAGVFFAGGRMSDEFGQANFAGEIGYGELPKGEDQIPFTGIDAPIRRRAEIHLVVRGHGDALTDPAALKEQLTQFNGGCPPNGCADVQASIHPSQFCRKRRR